MIVQIIAFYEWHGILPFLYLFSFKLVVIILGIGTALTLTTTVVNNTLYH